MGTMMKRMMSRVWIMMMPSFSVFRRFSCARVLNPGGRGGGDGEAGPLLCGPQGSASHWLSWRLEDHSSPPPPWDHPPLAGGKLGRGGTDGP